METPTPMIAEKAWPSKALRGCPRGERTALYSRIADAPYPGQLVRYNNRNLSSHTNDAMNAGGACRCMLSVLLNTAATTARPQNAPNNDQKAPKMFPTSCFCSFRYPRNLDTGVGSLCNGEGGMTRLRYLSISRCQLSAFLNTLILYKH